MRSWSMQLSIARKLLLAALQARDAHCLVCVCACVLLTAAKSLCASGLCGSRAHSAGTRTTHDERAQSAVLFGIDWFQRVTLRGNGLVRAAARGHLSPRKQACHTLKTVCAGAAYAWWPQRVPTDFCCFCWHMPPLRESSTREKLQRSGEPRARGVCVGGGVASP